MGPIKITRQGVQLGTTHRLCVLCVYLVIFVTGIMELKNTTATKSQAKQINQRVYLVIFVTRIMKPGHHGEKENLNQRLIY